jgi:hypothetical protein
MRHIRNLITYLSSIRLVRIAGGGLIGAGIGYLLMVVLRMGGTAQFAAAGAVIGLLITAIFDRDFKNTQLTQVQLTLPQFSSMTFVVNAEYRRVAWRLFIETSTRISSQPLGPEEGFLREAFNSLYGIFNTTRELLKAMDPSPSSGDRITVEMFAYDMLNKELRPFLSKWHPQLKAFEEQHADKREDEWELNQECRQELEHLRKQLLRYVRGFGELAGVSNLDHFVPRSDLD